MRVVRRWLTRLAGLFGRTRRDRELSAELESHLALHIDDNLRAGMTPEEARRHALIKLGGLEQTKQLYRERRGIPWLENLWQDVGHGARMLKRSPGSALAVIVLLALGMGGVLTLFGPLYSLVLSPLPFPHSDRIVRIGGDVPLFKVYSPEFVHRPTLRTIFSHVAAYRAPLGVPSTPSPGAHPVSVRVAAVTPDFFATLGVRPLLGQGLSKQSRTAPVVVVSNRFWRTELHGAKDVVGRPLPFGSENPRVIGIMPPGFDLPSGTDMWAPMFNGGGNVEMLGRLRPGISLDRAAAELKAVGPSRSPVIFGGMGTAGPVLESLHDYLLGNRRPLLWTLWSVSLLFLLLACAGAANLLLARGVQRQPEMVVRLTLGAGRTRLIRQLLAEALLLAAAGGLLGLGVAAGGVRWIGVMLPAARGAGSVSLASLGLIVLLAVAATVVCGLAPAFHATGGELNAFLKTGTSGITRSTLRHRLFGSHELLAGSQLVLAMVLLVSTGLLLRSMTAHLRLPLGFEPRNVAVVGPVMLPMSPALRKALRESFQEKHLRPSQLTQEEAAKVLQATQPERDADHARRRGFYFEALRRLAKLPGVVSAGAMDPTPFTQGARMGALYPGAVPKTYAPVLPAPGVQLARALRAEASPNSFRVLGIHLLAGRSFTAADVAQQIEVDKTFGARRHSETGVAIVNEALAQAFWPNENPVGKHFFPGGVDRTVIGLAPNVREYGRSMRAVPTLYLPFDPIVGGVDFVVKLRPGVPLSQFAASADHALTVLAPDIIRPKVRNLRELTGKSLANLRLTLLLLACFSALGTLVAALGVYATATVMAAARTREIGVRMALGAHPERIRGLAVWRSVRLALVALPLGALGSWLLALSLAHWLFHVGAADPVSYLTSSALLAVIVLAAGLIPARRASRVDPVVALREE